MQNSRHNLGIYGGAAQGQRAAQALAPFSTINLCKKGRGVWIINQAGLALGHHVAAGRTDAAGAATPAAVRLCARREKYFGPLPNLWWS